VNRIEGEFLIARRTINVHSLQATYALFFTFRKRSVCGHHICYQSVSTTPGRFFGVEKSCSGDPGFIRLVRMPVSGAIPLTSVRIRIGRIAQQRYTRMVL
jgi:hypothetical protein